MINKVILMGRLCADPELKTTQSGISLCSFRIAINRPHKQGEEQKADFVNIQAWRGTAEFVDKYFSKGSMIIVDGKLQNNDYTDANGVKHYSMRVIADNVSFGESKNASQGGSYGSDPPAQQNATAQAQPAQEPVQLGNLNDFEEILSDGEVPF